MAVYLRLEVFIIHIRHSCFSLNIWSLFFHIGFSRQKMFIQFS